MTENLDLTVAWWFAGVAVVMAIVVTVIYTVRVFRVSRTVKRQTARPLPDSVPDASVIVYSNGNPRGLAALLRQLREQDFPVRYEVVVVNDGRDYETEMLLMSLSPEWPELRHTFTPRVMRNVSRKKLALTLGMKAAVHDVAVHVTSSTRIESRDWLRRMAEPFNDPAVEVAIGYASPMQGEDTSRGCRHRAHDVLIASVHYLASALAGKAYRGDGDNLAYRRSTFFRVNGFSNTLNLHYGDDDIFVHDVTTPYNTAVVIGRDAQVISSHEHPVEVYTAGKYRYDFTSRFCNTSQNYLYDNVEIMLWIWLVATVTATVLSLGDWRIPAVMAGTALLLWIPQIMAWKKVSRRLSARKFMLSVPGALLMRPFRNAVYRIRSRSIHRANFTWQAIGNQQ